MPNTLMVAVRHVFTQAHCIARRDASPGPWLLQVVDLQLLHPKESRMGEEDVVTIQIVPCK